MANPPPLWPSSTDSQTDLLRKILTNIAFQIENGGGGGGAVTKIIAGSGIAVSPVNGLGNVTVSATGGGSANGYQEVTVTGQTTITTGNVRAFTSKITFAGAAGIRDVNFNHFVTGTTLHTAGDKLRLDIVFPATSGLVVTVWQTNAQLVKLLPVELFGAGQNFTTDGNILSACWSFIFDGAEWQFESSNLPA